MDLKPLLWAGLGHEAEDILSPRTSFLVMPLFTAGSLQVLFLSSHSPHNMRRRFVVNSRRTPEAIRRCPSRGMLRYTGQKAKPSTIDDG